MIITGILLLFLVGLHMWTTNKNTSIELNLFFGLFFGFAFNQIEDENAYIMSFQVALGFIAININVYEYK